MRHYICGESIKGATHERNGSPLQDSHRIMEVSDHITILSVADGHGSNKCPRSDRGSQMAVNAFCDVISRYLVNYGQTEDGLSNLVTFLNREGDMRFAQDVCEEWQSRVKNSFYKDKDELYLDDDGNYKWDEIYSLYGTTLLGLLITDTFIFTFQIGDGDINLVTKDSIDVLVEPEKFLGTETHSLSKPDAWRKSVSSLRRKEIESDEPYMYMLSTDGFANSYVSDEEFNKTCMDYFKMIEDHGFDAVKDNLGKWLKETSEFGCGDDITVVMAYFAK